MMNYSELIQQIALNDERYVVLTAENRALVRQLPQVLGNRFIDTGITEQCMIGMSAGLALRGRIPICHALAPFLIMRAFEFIRTDIGIPGLPVKLSGFIPGFLSEANGATHQALEDVSLMRGVPNMEVYCPADEDDMLQMLPVIWTSENPSYVRINTLKSEYKHCRFEKGKAEIIDIGNDVNILVYGMLFQEAMQAKRILEENNISVGLINLRSLKPIDEYLLLELAHSESLLVTMEDHFVTGGLYSILSEIFLRHKVTTDVLPIAMQDKWFRPALLQSVLEYEDFTGNQLAERIMIQMN